MIKRAFQYPYTLVTPGEHCSAWREKCDAGGCRLSHSFWVIPWPGTRGSRPSGFGGRLFPACGVLAHILHTHPGSGQESGKSLLTDSKSHNAVLSPISPDFSV
jgi:hypothetical protein